MPHVAPSESLLNYALLGNCGQSELSEGMTADIALFEMLNEGQQCVLGIWGGRIVWDTVGLSIPDVGKAGPYSNLK
jgi:hypothetical protein